MGKVLNVLLVAVGILAVLYASCLSLQFAQGPAGIRFFEGKITSIGAPYNSELDSGREIRIRLLEEKVIGCKNNQNSCLRIPYYDAFVVPNPEAGSVKVFDTARVQCELGPVNFWGIGRSLNCKLVTSP